MIIVMGLLNRRRCIFGNMTLMKTFCTLCTFLWPLDNKFIPADWPFFVCGSYLFLMVELLMDTFMHFTGVVLVAGSMLFQSLNLENGIDFYYFN